jgi:hypothetical protein
VRSYKPCGFISSRWLVWQTGNDQKAMNKRHNQIVERQIVERQIVELHEEEAL